MRPVAHALVFLLTLVALSFIRTAGAVEHNIAGSAQLDYHFAPTQPDANANAGTNRTFDGFTLEGAVKLAVDVSEHLSGNVKVCVGCHGLDVDMMYFDLRAADELNFRVGRFSPSFGAFVLRHDPANHKLSDKPLPYDMGRMLRKTAWNNGVLPAPFPDNGVEIDGTHWFGDALQVDYATYAVMGFKNDTSAFPADFDFTEAHVPNYFVDNNGRPTVGARLALTWKTGGMADVTLGASGMAGTYDPKNRLTYAILGADLAVRVHRTNVRMEYLVRRQRFSTDDPDAFKFAFAADGGDFFAKHGAYVEVEQPIVQDLDAIARLDGMARVGNVAVGNPLSSDATVVRETLGFAYAIERNFRLKGSGELWQFNGADPITGRKTELGIHMGVVCTF